jgi:hypothetical protein
MTKTRAGNRIAKAPGDRPAARPEIIIIGLLLPWSRGVIVPSWNHDETVPIIAPQVRISMGLEKRVV